jgi:hypothetical protein
LSSFFIVGLFSTFAPLLKALTDPAGYSLTYCHLVNKKEVYKRYKLKSMCRHRVQIFEEEVNY